MTAVSYTHLDVYKRQLFYLKGVVPKEVTIKDIYLGVIPFVLLQVSMVALCFVFPQIITWLPAQMYGGN